MPRHPPHTLSSLTRNRSGQATSYLESCALPCLELVATLPKNSSRQKDMTARCPYALKRRNGFDSNQTLGRQAQKHDCVMNHMTRYWVLTNPHSDFKDLGDELCRLPHRRALTRAACKQQGGPQHTEWGSPGLALSRDPGAMPFLDPRGVACMTAAIRQPSHQRGKREMIPIRYGETTG